VKDPLSSHCLYHMSATKVNIFIGRQHTKSIGDIDLIKITAHNTKSRCRDERQVEFGKEEGFILWDVERYGWSAIILRSFLSLELSLDQK
jgi:hypothetical protein